MDASFESGFSFKQVDSYVADDSEVFWAMVFAYTEAVFSESIYIYYDFNILFIKSVCCVFSVGCKAVGPPVHLFKRTSRAKVTCDRPGLQPLSNVHP